MPRGDVTKNIVKEAYADYTVEDLTNGLTTEELLARIPDCKDAALGDVDYYRNAALDNQWFIPLEVSSAFGLRVPIPHKFQRELIENYYNGFHNVCLAGRRGGKTHGAAILAVSALVRGKRVIYATPRANQARPFWNYCIKMLYSGLSATGGIRKIIAGGGTRRMKVETENKYMKIYQNPTAGIISTSAEDFDSCGAIYVYTVFNPDALRGNNADLLILDEVQMMEPTALFDVGLPMLADRNGRAVLIFTMPSAEVPNGLRPGDQYFALKLYHRVRDWWDKKNGINVDRVYETDDGIDDDNAPSILLQDDYSSWKTITFTTIDNPHIPREAIDQLRASMTRDAFMREIMCDEVANTRAALWTQGMIDSSRVSQHNFSVQGSRVAIAIDPAIKRGVTGIVAVAAKPHPVDGKMHYWVFKDMSTNLGPEMWPHIVANLYNEVLSAGGNPTVVVEENQGGEMLKTVLRFADVSMRIFSTRAMLSKAERAIPVVNMYADGKVHHVGVLTELEEEMVTWNKGSKRSPNRLDALVWAVTWLSEKGGIKPNVYSVNKEREKRMMRQPK